MKCTKTKAIQINKLGKSFEKCKVISNFSLTVKEGDFVAIFGPNGCGKTTLLNILSGVTQKSSGEVNFIGFENKKFSYIFQNYRESLLLWKNSFENIAFPLRLQHLSEEIIHSKIAEMEKMFSFKGNLLLYPYELSGGQQQILSFMRALVTEPKMLFIDEPFSALDYENSLRLRKHLQNYYTKYKPTVLAITHDIEEAVHLANKIVVLSKKPSKIISIIENNAPYPRTTGFLTSKEFSKIKEKVLLEFRKGASI